jgi:hypothetical protein
LFAKHNSIPEFLDVPKKRTSGKVIISILCEISGSDSGKYEDYSLLGYSVM